MPKPANEKTRAVPSSRSRPISVPAAQNAERDGDQEQHLAHQLGGRDRPRGGALAVEAVRARLGHGAQSTPQRQFSVTPFGRVSRYPGRRRSTSSRGRSPCPTRSSSCSSVVSSRAPVEPSGWPSAIAPPLTFTRSMSGSSSRCHASTTGANASLTSNEVDVADRHAVALEQLARGRDRAREHHHRVDADRRLVDDPRPRLHARARPPSRRSSAAPRPRRRRSATSCRP